MAITIVVGNFKGGVGKTKVSVMASWELAMARGKKVLLVDMDPQGNASTLIARSAGVSELNTSIFDGFQKGDLKDCIVNVADNLHVIPAQVSFKNLALTCLSKKKQRNQQQHLQSHLLKNQHNLLFLLTN